MPTAIEMEVAAPTSGKVLVTGIALSSFSALLLELGLTRLFSVVLFYHFAFLAISIALLGLGAGGVFAHLRKKNLQRYELRNFASTCSCLNALMIPLVLEIVLHVPVSLELTAGNFVRLTAIYLASRSRSSLPVRVRAFRGSTPQISQVVRSPASPSFRC
jgi:hypothetical protein